MEYIAYILIVVGLVFFLGTSIGLLRFPDFYTRMHAAGKGDTLSTVLILAGCIFAVASQGQMSWLLGLKILLIINFVFIGSPTATHAIARAAHFAGVKPLLKTSSGAQTDKGDA